jgi:glucose/arabinose dehydrogenase
MIARRSYLLLALTLGACATGRDLPEQGDAGVSQESRPLEPEQEGHAGTAVAPKTFPPIPRAALEAAWVPDGFEVEVVARDLVYPTSVELDDDGNVYVAEAGFAYGDLAAIPRVWRITPGGEFEVACEVGLEGPINDLLWHEGRLYVSHRGKVSWVAEDGACTDVVTGLPSYGDHHNNQLAAGPDGKLYVGVGTATNSGVVGLDNIYPFLWLTQYPDVHDLSPYPLKLAGESYTTPDPLTVLARQGEMTTTLSAVRQILSPSKPLLVHTGAFQPFGRDAGEVEGQVKANGTILRFDPDGSNLEVHAWGFRNPFGLAFGPDGQLYATDEGFDERGSRPIANAPDCVWRVREGGWYGFPDFAGGVPVTDERFRPSRGDPPELLLEEHPRCEQPLLARPPHATPGKLEVASGLGFREALFVAEIGGGQPIAEPGQPTAGFQVAVIDLRTREVTPLLSLRDRAFGPPGYERVATAGPRRPIDVRLSRDGEALYVVDFGAMATYLAGAGPMARPFPGSGVLWRITRAGAREQSPPADLSPVPGRGAAAGK